ncbi:DUF3817 domain-containing protein [Nocardioides sp. ChNu-153]|uniref:DUF3817 domain-containing protein n=1 Tax=unclassified Nocardioides TaxID=2615069 RepID=UPI002406BE18|nr:MULTISPECIES: DUF3817 domain-containing protein [unclassified Nocardioides]MDF9717077.1 DUF3817 domain-containing protein [Nocardioides sp. ChNu-99]MDN7121506.1 DUF3817 domain-containing protein [Nocardioides sp. ChNu-153]
MRGTLLRYRVMATIVGVLLVVLILVGVPLANFDGTEMWGFVPSTPAWVTPGSGAQEIGEAITHQLGVAHGWLYMIFLVTAFLLARKALWEPGFTVLVLLCGTVPLLSFWAEHKATARVKKEYAAELAAPRGAPAA